MVVGVEISDVRNGRVMHVGGGRFDRFDFADRRGDHLRDRGRRHQQAIAQRTQNYLMHALLPLLPSERWAGRRVIDREEQAFRKSVGWRNGGGIRTLTGRKRRSEIGFSRQHADRNEIRLAMDRRQAGTARLFGLSPERETRDGIVERAGTR